MKNIIQLILSLPDNPIKKGIRNVFYSDVISERIFEYSLVNKYLYFDPNLKVKVLDIGCYYSNFPLSLASMGYSVTAIDLMDYQLTHPNLEFIKMDFIKE